MIKRGSIKEVGFGLGIELWLMSIGMKKRRTTGRPSIMRFLCGSLPCCAGYHRKESVSHGSSGLFFIPSHPFPTMWILLKGKANWSARLNPSWLSPTGYISNSQKWPKSFWDQIPMKSQPHDLYLFELFLYSSKIQTPKSPKGSHICLLNKFSINSLAEAAPSNASSTLFT